MLDDAFEELAEDSGRVQRSVLLDQFLPQLAKGRAEVANQLSRNLSHRLRLAGQLGQVVPVVDRPTARWLPQMGDAAMVSAVGVAVGKTTKVKAEFTSSEKLPKDAKITVVGVSRMAG